MSKKPEGAGKLFTVRKLTEAECSQLPSEIEKVENLKAAAKGNNIQTALKVMMPAVLYKLSKEVCKDIVKQHEEYLPKPVADWAPTIVGGLASITASYLLGATKLAVAGSLMLIGACETYDHYNAIPHEGTTELLG